MKIKDKRKLTRVIATWLVTGIMLSVFSLDIVSLIIENKYVSATSIKDEDFLYKSGDDRIHFLNTANSDCILLESNGHFVLVDSGEGNENPRKKTEYKGYRDEVIEYLKKVAKNKNGIVKLDFIVATHMHYDHAGNFTHIINHKDIEIGKAYIKEYDVENVSQMESENWGNKQMYLNIIDALKKRNIPIINEFSSSDIAFGDFTLNLLNGEKRNKPQPENENANSIGIKVIKGKSSAFLAADFTADTGLESRFADEIGDIDLLKIGHHGYYGSSSASFLKVLKPEIAICTNYIGKIYPNVKWNLIMVAKCPVFSTVHRNGVIATFTDNDEIILTQNIM